MNHVSYRVYKRETDSSTKASNHFHSERLCHLCVTNLRTEAIEEAKPYVHKSKATGLEQEVAQEEGNAPVRPAAVDQ